LQFYDRQLQIFTAISIKDSHFEFSYYTYRKLIRNLLIRAILSAINCIKKLHSKVRSDRYNINFVLLGSDRFSEIEGENSLAAHTYSKKLFLQDTFRTG